MTLKGKQDSKMDRINSSIVLFMDQEFGEEAKSKINSNTLSEIISPSKSFKIFLMRGLGKTKLDKGTTLF